MIVIVLAWSLSDSLGQVPALSLIVYPNWRLNTLHVFSNSRTFRLLWVFLYDDHASVMTHTYIIRIGHLLFQWQKLLTSACRVSAVAESVSDTARSTGFAQIMLAHFPASNAVFAAVFNRTDYCIRTLNTLALLILILIWFDLEAWLGLYVDL